VELRAFFIFKARHAIPEQAGVNMQLVSRRWNAEHSERAKILMLHGMGGTGSLWRPIAAGLERDYSILAPDQRGHGGSRIDAIPGGRTPVTYTPLDFGRDLVDTLEKEHFHPTWVLGHSMGVRSACALAHLKPEWVQGLILVDLGFSGVAGGGLGEGLARFIRMLPERFASRDEARTLMTANCPDPAIAQYLMAVSVRLPDGQIEFPFDHSALIATITAARDTSVSTWVRELAQKNMPILVLRGEKSLVWSRTSFEAERQALAPFPTVVFEEFPGAGHGLPFEKRPEFTSRIQAFIEGRDGK
jgi:pimeloyl-ACP methyl ester carboxylesterase